MIITITNNDNINWNAETYVDKKINEILGVIKAKKGEIPFLRGVGISDEYVDNPISIIKPVLINDITATINEFVNGVTLQNVEILSGETVGDYNIKVVCKIE